MKNLPGPQTLVDHIDTNCILEFTRWSRAEQHNLTMNLAAEEIAQRWKIELAMNVWMKEFLRNELADSSVDGTVAKAIVKYSTILKENKPDNELSDNDYLSSSAVVKIPIFAWVTNRYFHKMQSLLTGADGWLDRKIICTRCGSAARTWKHIFSECKHCDVDIRIENLFTETMCKMECEKICAVLEKMPQRQNESMIGKLFKCMSFDDQENI